MAARTATRSITDIMDFGTMPYEVAYHVLKNVKNPAQLHEIEENSPHIADADSELWRAFIIRDIPNWKEKMITPKNPRSWWKVYRKLMREEELIAAAQEEALRKQLVINTIKKSEQSITYVPQIVAYTPGKGDTLLDPEARLRAAAAGSRWDKKKKSGEKIVSALLRQTAEARSAKKPFQPTHAGSSLEAAKRQISHAPATMIAAPQHRVQPRALLPHQQALLDERRRYQTDVMGGMQKSGRKLPQSTAIADAQKSKHEVNEKKLRELTNSRPAPSTPNAPTRTVEPYRSKPVYEKVTRGEGAKTAVTWKRKHVEESQPASSHIPTAESASPQPKPTSPQPALIKRKRPAATSIFMAKKQKK